MDDNEYGNMYLFWLNTIRTPRCDTNSPLMKLIRDDLDAFIELRNMTLLSKNGGKVPLHFEYEENENNEN